MTRGEPAAASERRGLLSGPLPVRGFRPLAMELSNDCGPTALLQALRCLNIEIEREKLLDVWRFREGADRFDTPGHHLRVLRRLGVPVAMRRRIARVHVERALRAGRPVVTLLPAGFFRWHWVVVCGLAGETATVSPGDGSLVSMRASVFSVTGPHAGRRSPWPSRLLRIDGLGYCLGRPFPFPPDEALERDMLRLASFAEDALAPTERMLRIAAELIEKAVGIRRTDPAKP